MKIMLVEDNPKTLELIKNILRNSKSTNEFIESDSEDEAVQLYANQQPAYVFMDINLKQGNGLSATERIIRDYPAAKIVMLTLYDELEYREAAQKAGAFQYIVKDKIYEITQLFK